MERLISKYRKKMVGGVYFLYKRDFRPLHIRNEITNNVT